MFGTTVSPLLLTTPGDTSRSSSVPLAQPSSTYSRPPSPPSLRSLIASTPLLVDGFVKTVFIPQSFNASPSFERRSSTKKRKGPRPSKTVGSGDTDHSVKVSANQVGVVAHLKNFFVEKCSTMGDATNSGEVDMAVKIDGFDLKHRFNSTTAHLLVASSSVELLAGLC